nr:MAG TPA: baseplate wedge protein [Caudoviricetes sp.]
MYIQNTLVPYAEIEHKGIQYTTCRDYSHISRHACLRQVVHNPEDGDRFIALETANGFSTHTDVVYHDVKSHEENRLDVLAYQYLGSAQYAWVIALFNNIEDGYTIHEGQRLVIPKSISSLFSKGEILAPVPALKLNLGSE